MRADGEGLGGARRVLLHGVTGSGKTTLARRLSQLTGLPWTEADSVNWLPGWQQRPLVEQRARVEAVCAQDAWILDSAYTDWADLVLPRAQLVVGLDWPRWRSLARLVRRTVTRILDRHEVCNGNVETWRAAFSRDSIVAWHFRSFAGKRARLDAWEADPSAPPVLRFRRPRDLERWLAELEHRSGPCVSEATDRGRRPST